MKNFFSGRTRFLIHWLVVILFALSSCDSFNSEKVKPSTNLEIGEETVVATQTIPSSGGTVTVNSAASEIDGLEIVVSPQSYTTSKTFIISTAPITNHTLGQYFNPLTPLIQIENGGGYSDSIMEITIPIELPDGEFPLGFYYDEITGTLEAIPVKEYTSTSITLLTRHFMSASDLTPSYNNLKSGGIKIDPSSNLVISSISESIINSTPIISSGFKVGTDDWEFPNYGSYIAEGGHCAGQNMCAMWYYFEKKLKAEGDLFNKFNTVNSLWQDNAIGYRFCSVIHNDLDWDGKVADLFGKYIDKNQKIDQLKFYTIAGAILTTGEPQGIGIYRQIGTRPNGKPKYGGHDLICYQVSVNEGKLFISDPNKPGNSQEIIFKNGKFEPYIAKANGNATSNPYPYVTYYAKTAYIEWNKIGNRYTELLDSTIGNKAPNIFPPYAIWIKEETDEVLTNNYTTDSDTLRCIVECPTAERTSFVDGKKLIPFDLYDEDGKQIETWEQDKFGAFTILKPGINKIGFYIYATKNSAVYNGSYANLFIDFKWFDVYYSKLEIDPNPITGETKKNIEITAVSNGTAPANAKYVWNFGDGTKEVTVINDSTITHKYSTEGSYTVVAKIYDNSNNKLLGRATAKANIVDGISNDFQKFKYVSIVFKADIRSNNILTTFSSLSIYNLPPVGSTVKCPLAWNGFSFSAKFAYDFPEDSRYLGTYHSSGSISGSITADGLTISSFTAEVTDVFPDISTSHHNMISVNNIPYQKNQGTSPRFGLEGETVGQKVSEFSMREDYSDSQYMISTSVFYNSTYDEPFLYIDFYESN